MRKINLFLVRTLMVLSLIFAIGCSKDDESGDNGSKTVPDPEGTKSMFLQNPDYYYNYQGIKINTYVFLFFNDDAFIYVSTDLRNIHCGNSHGGYWYYGYISPSITNDKPNIEIADIGLVNGLGNITKKPTSGWSSQAALVQGNGYVVRIGDAGSYTYVRIYVVSEKYDGAQVKYQYPF